MSATTTRPASRARLAGLGRLIRRNQGALIAGALFAALLIVYQVQSGSILKVIQIRILLNGSLALIWAALGVTIVVVTGGFDLSVGAVMSLTNVLAATLLTGGTADIGIVLLILAIGGIVGMLSGVMVAVARIQSIIVTLAAMFIWSGVALLIMPQPGGLIPSNVTEVLGGTIGGQLPAAVVWLAVIVAGIALIRRTPVWAQLFAIGSDEVAARRSGVRVTRVAILAYGAAGVCYALAGLFLGAQTTGGDANIGNPFLLTSFAAVVLGGTPLGGGRGTFVGSIVGALIMATLATVLLALGITSYWTDVVQGSVLIFAVVLPTLIARLGTWRTEGGA